MVLAIERLREAAGASKVMILLTDGSHNAGDVEPLQAAQIASALGIRIYTIGAGTRGIALMPTRAATAASTMRRPRCSSTSSRSSASPT